MLFPHIYRFMSLLKMRRDSIWLIPERDYRLVRVLLVPRRGCNVGAIGRSNMPHKGKKRQCRLTKSVHDAHHEVKQRLQWVFDWHPHGSLWQLCMRCNYSCQQNCKYGGDLR